jgi:Transglycosylase SLT domain
MQDYLARLAQIESSNNPLARNSNSSAKGLYQFIDSTAKQYGINAPFGTPEYTQQEQQAVMKFTEDNRNALSQFLGREPTQGELYLAHQQGVGGAKRILSNPNARAVDLVGEQAINQNAGNPDMTAEQFAQQWTGKFDQPQMTSNDAQLTINGQGQNFALQEPQGRQIQLPDGRVLSLTGQESPEQLQALKDKLRTKYKQEAQPTAQVVPTQQGDAGGGARAYTYALTGGQIPFGNVITSALGASVARVASPFTGDPRSIGELYDQAQADTKATQEANPLATLAGNITGIATTLPLASIKVLNGTRATTGIRGVVNEIPDALSKVGNFVRGGSVAKAGAGQALLRGAKAGAVAAPAGALYGAGEAESGKRFEGALSGAGLAAGVGAALPVAGSALGAVGTVLTPKADEGLAAVAKLAQKYKIPLSADQITRSPVYKNIQKVTKEIPFSGSQDFRETQLLRWQNEVLKRVGVESDRFTPEIMDKAFTKAGGQFDKLTKGKTFNIGGTLIDDLTKIGDEVKTSYGDDAYKAFERESLKIISDFKAGDEITGEIISRQRARINKLARKSNDMNTKSALSELEGALVDGITSKDLKLAKQLTQAKQTYKNLIAVEPIATKAKGGMISPSQLNSRMAQVYGRSHTRGKSGELGDLARIGSELLPELGGSDTTQKVLTASALLGGGLGGFLNPLIPATIGGGIGIARGLQKGVLQNEGLMQKMLSKSDDALTKVGRVKSPLQIKNTIKKT